MHTGRPLFVAFVCLAVHALLKGLANRNAASMCLLVRVAILQSFFMREHG